MQPPPVSDHVHLQPAPGGPGRGGRAPRRAPLRSAALPQGLSGGGGVTRADTRAGIAPPCRLAAATGPFKIAVSLSFPPRLPSLSSSFSLPGAGLAAGRAFPELAPAVLSQTAPRARPRGPAAPRGCSPRLAPPVAAGGRQARGLLLARCPRRGLGVCPARPAGGSVTRSWHRCGAPFRLAPAGETRTQRAAGKTCSHFGPRQTKSRRRPRPPPPPRAAPEPPAPAARPHRRAAAPARPRPPGGRRRRPTPN